MFEIENIFAHDTQVIAGFRHIAARIERQADEIDFFIIYNSDGLVKSRHPDESRGPGRS